MGEEPCESFFPPLVPEEQKAKISARELQPLQELVAISFLTIEKQPGFKGFDVSAVAFNFCSLIFHFHLLLEKSLYHHSSTLKSSIRSFFFLPYLESPGSVYSLFLLLTKSQVLCVVRCVGPLKIQVAYPVDNIEQ